MFKLHTYIYAPGFRSRPDLARFWALAPALVTIIKRLRLRLKRLKRLAPAAPVSLIFNKRHELRLHFFLAAAAPAECYNKMNNLISLNLESSPGILFKAHF